MTASYLEELIAKAMAVQSHVDQGYSQKQAVHFWEGGSTLNKPHYRRRASTVIASIADAGLMVATRETLEFYRDDPEGDGGKRARADLEKWGIA